MGHRPPAPKVRYVDQIVGDELSGVDFGFFGAAYRDQDADVVHVHDLDALLGEGKDPDRVAAAEEFIAALTSRSIALVQTLLPRDPRDTPAHQVLDRATNAFIILDEDTATPDPEITTLIPHAHFRDRFLGYPRGERIQGRVLCVSRTDTARSAEAPLKVFSVVDTADLTLRVVGEEDPDLEPLIGRAVRRTNGAVSARLETLSEAEIVREIDGAEVVLLPETESLEDLTVLFLVLSLDRPVILPRSSTATALASEVGPGWIQTYEGPLTAEVLDEAVEAVRTAERGERPHLDGRDLETTAREYAEVFRRAARSVGR
ncbi:hypothetical protein [Nesterenkonia flava]|uniref:hypothetical protein n=1 Tax=Nesterenkonia flava TaxID=469799 RepID=UPI00286E9EB6|nr:hypothetical protein [Nesterenkonia flava]